MEYCSSFHFCSHNFIIQNAFLLSQLVSTEPERWWVMMMMKEQNSQTTFTFAPTHTSMYFLPLTFQFIFREFSNGLFRMLNVECWMFIRCSGFLFSNSISNNTLACRNCSLSYSPNVFVTLDSLPLFSTIRMLTHNGVPHIFCTRY